LLAKRTTDNPEAYNAYVQGRYLWRKRTEETLRKAIEHFESAIELDSNYALAYSGLADAWSVLLGYRSYRSMDTYLKAMEAAEKALGLDDQLVEAHASMGLVLRHAEQYEKAEQEFLRAIELNPGYVWTHTWYANLLSDMGRRDEYLERLQIAYELDPLNVVTLINLGSMKTDARKWEEAEALYRQALELEPSPNRVIRLGNHLRTLGRRQEAIDLFEQAIEQFPKNKPLYSALWNMYVYDEDLDAALQTVERLHEQKQDDTLRILWRGEVYHAVNDFDQAIENYQRFMELKPASGAAINQMISACINAGRFEEAMRYADMMVEGRPEGTWSYLVRAQTNAIQGRLDRAIEDLEKAMELFPDTDNPRLYEIEGTFRLYQGDWDNARSLFQEKLVESVYPSFQISGRFSVACLLAVQGQFKQALAYTDSSLVVDSLNDNLWSMKDGRKLRMFIYEEMNDLKQAERESRRVVEIVQEVRPGEVIAWQDYLAQILAGRGEFVEATAIADKLKAATEAGGWSLTKFAYCYTQGTIELARGNYEESLRLLKTSADAMSKRASINYFQASLQLARAYLESGKAEEAIAVYETILSNAMVDRIHWVVQITKARYHLARAYEQAGRSDDAIVQYEDFLKRWGKADVRLESVEDARTRMARLKGES
jgi:pentatricopeptide repeat protein